VDLLVVGHVTRDEVEGSVRLGGAGSYASLAAACLGYETALVTSAPPDDPLLEPLRRAPRLQVHCVPSDVMTTFALDYAGGQRRLWLRRRARPLALEDIPAAWRRPRVAYVGPVASECDGAFVRGLHAQFVGAGLQGWLRRVRDDGLVETALLAQTPEVQDAPRLDVAILSEEDHPGGNAVVQGSLGRGGTAAITRGARGATLIRSTESIEIPAAPAREVDPTGAGDVFGVVLTLELAHGKPLGVAGRAAAAAAARVVEGAGLGTLPGALPWPGV
jgi:sugar/nucleoside kinase (ribokinase family)